MNTIDVQNRIEELLADESFAGKISACGSCEELAELFTSENVPMSIDDAERLVALVNQKDNTELDENDLSFVAGGLLTTTGSFIGNLADRLIKDNRGPITVPVVPRQRVQTLRN